MDGFGPCWNKEPGTPTWIPGAQELGSPPAVFPGKVEGSWIRNRAAGSQNSTLIRCARITGSSLIPLCHMPAPGFEVQVKFIKYKQMLESWYYDLHRPFAILGKHVCSVTRDDQPSPGSVIMFLALTTLASYLCLMEAVNSFSNRGPGSGSSLWPAYSALGIENWYYASGISGWNVISSKRTSLPI